MYHNCRWEYLSTLHSPTMKCFLKLCIALSILFSLLLLGGSNCYLMSMVVIAIFKVVGASFSMKWNPSLIPQLFKSPVSSVKACIISMSLLFFISSVRMTLQSYTYMTYMCLFPLLYVMGKHPYRYE